MREKQRTKSGMQLMAVHSSPNRAYPVSEEQACSGIGTRRQARMATKGQGKGKGTALASTHVRPDQTRPSWGGQELLGPSA